MKILIQYLILTLFSIGSLVCAQSEQIVRDASVRIIRYDDLEKALQGNELPASYTGFLIHRHPADKGNDGEILTSAFAATDDNGRLDDPRQNPSYLVLMPVYNSENKVVTVRAYRAKLVRMPNMEAQVAVLRIAPEQGLPAVVKATESPIAATDPVTVVGYKKYEPGNQQAKLNILEELKRLKEVQDNACKTVQTDGNNKHEDFMAYMSVSQTASTVSLVSPSASPHQRIELTTSFDNNLLGGAVVSAKNKYLVGIYVLRNDNRPTACDYKSAGVELETQLPWMWIGVGAAALLIIGGLVMIIVRKSARSSRKHKPLIRLRGEDGTWYDISSARLRKGVTLGRSSKADLVFSKDSISRIHAAVSALEGRVVIIDKDSKGGTFVNGTRLVPGQPQKLHNADVIKLSDFKVTVETLSRS